MNVDTRMKSRFKKSEGNHRNNIAEKKAKDGWRNCSAQVLSSWPFSHGFTGKCMLLLTTITMLRRNVSTKETLGLLRLNEVSAVKEIIHDGEGLCRCVEWKQFRAGCCRTVTFVKINFPARAPVWFRSRRCRVLETDAERPPQKNVLAFIGRIANCQITLFWLS